jgi:hypothetical protein
MHHRWSASRGVQLGRFGAGVAGFPLAVLLHELAHFFAFSALGFEGTVLRHASVEWSRSQEFWHLVETGNSSAVSAITEPWKVAVATAAGPVITYLTVLMGVLLTRRLGPSALILAVALAAPLRSVSTVPLLSDKLLGRESPARFDETRLASLTNVPETLLLVLAVAFLVGGWWLIVQAVPRDQRRQQLAPVLPGILVGGCLWLLWLGPWLLP